MTTSFTPFELQGSDAPERSTPKKNSRTLRRQESSDGISAVSFQSEKTSSTTDGIDVLGGEPPPDTFLNWNTTWSGRIINDRIFKKAVIALILIDSIMMGVATFDFVTESETLERVFGILNMTFLSLFTIELFLRILHHRKEFVSSGWIIFDLVVIGCSWITSYLTIVRTFRVIRSLRLATRLKGLRNMTLALYQVMPKILSVAFVLGLSFYIFSIMFTDLYKDLYEQGYTTEDYFSSIDVTAFTLFQMMTLDQWSVITKEVQLAHPWAWVLFLAFVVSSSFFILNLAVAVVYEAVVRVQQNQGDGPIVPNRGLGAGANAGSNRDTLNRLENKVDDLAASVELLLRKQMVLQESVSDMSQSNLL